MLVQEEGVTLREGVGVREVRQGSLLLEDGSAEAFDECLWCTQASAPAWLAKTGLQTGRPASLCCSALLLPPAWVLFLYSCLCGSFPFSCSCFWMLLLSCPSHAQLLPSGLATPPAAPPPHPHFTLPPHPTPTPPSSLHPHSAYSNTLTPRSQSHFQSHSHPLNPTLHTPTPASPPGSPSPEAPSGAL